MEGGFTVTSARSADPTVLLELAAALRRTLRTRGEQLPAAWPEEATADLRTGRLEGCLVTDPRGGRALGILSLRERHAFGQIHVDAEGEPPHRVALAERSLVALAELRPAGCELLDVGVTGLTDAEEESLSGLLRGRPEMDPIRRFGLVRPLSSADPPAPLELPPGYRWGLSQEVGIAELALLDVAAFQDGPDASFLSDTPEGDQRLLAGIRAGQLGRVLEEASPTLIDPEGRTVGFALTVEESARSALLADLALDPHARGRGLGRALLVRVLRALVALGHSEARLWVTEANAPARALYDSTGFRPEATAYVYRVRRQAGSSPSPHSG